jgi:hypothetical protein
MDSNAERLRPTAREFQEANIEASYSKVELDCVVLEPDPVCEARCTHSDGDEGSSG